jgi:hypothetical protein
MGFLDARRRPRVRPGGRIPVQLWMEDQDDEEISTFGLLIDMSEIGLGVRLGAPIEVGSTVDLALTEYLLVGSVVNCVGLPEGGFRIGLELLHAMSEGDWQGILHSCGISSDDCAGKIHAVPLLPELPTN